jgi:fatty acid-binding protein DegV
MTINWTEKDGTTREEFASIDWDVLSIKEFYDILRNGIRIFTSQITEENYLNTFVPHLEKGEDIIYLACSSGLSASLKTAELLAEGQLKERFPDRKLW